MTIQELQIKVDKWIKEKGIRYFDEKTNTILLMEEVGEFSRIIARKYGEQSFKEGEKYDINDELADIIFVLTCLANQMNINIEEAIENNFAKKDNRDSERHKNNPKLYK